MAESYNTLAGLVQINDQNLADINVSDLLQGAPTLAAINAVTASNGTVHKYLKETTASSAAFRAPLAGLTKTASADTLVTDTLKLLDASFATDVAIARGFKDGKDAYLQRELMRSLKQVFFVAETQIYNGVNGDSGGFVGLRDDAQLDALADAMVISAATAGTTADEQSSVYLMRSTDDDVSIVLGNDGNIVADEDPSVIEKLVNPGTDNKTYPAYYVAVLGWLGFQIGGSRSAARICNVETALTDDDIYNALSLFPAGMEPTHISMNRASLALLRASRTAVNIIGAPAPFPAEVGGIPIIVTDGVSQTEAVLS